MTILLVAPPLMVATQHRGMLTTEPVEHLGLECIAGACIKAGIEDVACLDCHMAGLTAEEAAARILKMGPRMVGFSVRYEQTDLEGAATAVNLLRKAGYEGLIVAGGMAATYMDEHLLTSGFDAVIRGEGEVGFTQLAKDYLSGNSWYDVPNLSYRVSGQIARNKSGFITDLGQLPRPARQLLAQCFAFQQTKGIPIETSRGCWRPCAFCAVPDFHGAKWRAKPLRKALREIQDFYYDGISVDFVDDNFLGPPILHQKRIDELRAALAELGYRIKFSLCCRAESISEKTIKQLHQLGLERVYIGFESGSESMLQRLTRHSTVAAGKRAIEVLIKTAVPASFNLVMLDPFTTVAELKENIDFIKSTEIYKMGMRPLSLLNTLKVLKGTKYYNALKAQGMLKPLGNTMFSYEFQDWKTSIIHDLVSHMEQVVPGLLMQLNQINYRYYCLTHLIRRRYGLSEQEMRLIPELHYDFITQLLRWHDNLPGLIISIYDSVIDIVDEEFDEKMRSGVKLAITEQVYNFMNKYLKGDLCYLTISKVKKLLGNKHVTLSLPSGELVEFESPLIEPISRL